MHIKQLFTAKIFTSILLCLLILAGVSALPAGALEAKPTFAGTSGTAAFQTLEEAEAAIVRLYNDNYTEIAQKIREIRGISFETLPDEALTLYWGSCGPTSIAFQKVLIDNGIYAETRMDAQMYAKHEYNLFRTRLTDGTVKYLLVDGSYRQFTRTYFKDTVMQSTGKPSEEVTDNDIDAAILASGLPNVLAYEYGNKDEAAKKIKDVLGEDVDESAYNWMDGAYESQIYPEPELQTIRTRYLTQEDIVILKSGLPYDKPFDDSLYLTGSWDNFAARQRFVYKGNGVYEVVFSVNPFAGDGIFTCRIEGEQSGVFRYGAANTDAVFPILNTYYNHFTVQAFLTNNEALGQDIVLNASGIDHIALRIDTRAGVDAPLLRAIPASQCGIYGDIDYNGIIDLQDILLLQKALGHQIALTDPQKLLSGVSGNDTLCVEDILLIQRYLAHYPDAGRTGQNAYAPVG